MSKRAVVLLSGGLDSATILPMALEKYDEVHTINFDYGQLHQRESKAAKQQCEYWRQQGKQVKGPLTLSIPALKTIGGSALTDETIELPLDREETETGIPTSYVPGRNTVFLALAMSYAEKIGAEAIYHGANHLDYSGYRDCRPEYMEVMNDVCRIATTDCGVSEEWVVGFIEGEGCFSRASYSTKKGKVYYPVFSLQQSDLDVVVLLQNFFGTGFTNERKWEGKSNISKKRSWEFRLSYYDAYLVVELMQGKFKNPSREDQFNDWVKQFEDQYLNPDIAWEKLAEKGVKRPIRIVTPIINKSKAEIVKIGMELGVPFHLTWSCYKGGDLACGKCDACRFRLKGFREAGFEDPLQYAQENESSTKGFSHPA